MGTAGSKSSKSMVALNNAVRHATDGSIGILDVFGFEDPKVSFIILQSQGGRGVKPIYCICYDMRRLNNLQPSCLEHLCINLCAETTQHFYNTHIFKSSIESCRDENIRCDVHVDYMDSVPCINLISSLVSDLPLLGMKHSKNLGVNSFFSRYLLKI